ncbi:MAG: hypothetical protein LHW56_08315 [Candidatus Cloacimonetes bacterium]|jgi:hypothetical protein|nr:hypothetical protein [Candidatus Cloacimonadota bacterium]MDY0172897.1 hypothetical protein [Candidatus Cloacimonadaceae bacterium]
MKVKLLVILLIASAVLGAKSTADELTLDRTWIYFDLGKGKLKEKVIIASEGGVVYEYNQKIYSTIYRVIYQDDREKMIEMPHKYSFHGYGVQVGPVFRKGKFKLIPSLGVEFGKLTTGENLIHSDGWFGGTYHWETVNKETVTFVPISVVAKYNLTGWIGLRAKASANIHKDYPLYHAELGLCLGRL